MNIKQLLHSNLKNIFLIFLVFIYHGIATSQVIPVLHDKISENEIFKKTSIGLGAGELAYSPNYTTAFKGVNGKIAEVCLPVDNSKIVPMNLEVSVKLFKAVLVDKDNNKWFNTEAGIVSFNGEKWTIHDKNSKVTPQEIKGIAYEDNPHGQEIWIASQNGITVVSLPVDAQSGATGYYDSTSSVLSNNVLRVAVAKSPTRWFGTDKGISAFKSNKWLKPDYEEFYPEFIFQEFPILSMAANLTGDTLYAGTNGAGIARFYSNDVDGISGASVLAQWGPMILPSDKIYSIYIAPDGAKWFGTDLGVARHIGNNSLDGWTAFTTENGLINNFVQAITSDKEGNIWFGTNGGISVFNGSKWTSYTEENGLSSNNVLCIAVDNSGVIWIGTDKGVTSIEKGSFTIYK